MKTCCAARKHFPKRNVKRAESKRCGAPLKRGKAMPDEAMAPQRAFTKEEEERKREAYLKTNPSLKLSMISAAITFAERNLPPHLRHNPPPAPPTNSGGT